MKVLTLIFKLFVMYIKHGNLNVEMYIDIEMVCLEIESISVDTWANHHVILLNH